MWVVRNVLPDVLLAGFEKVHRVTFDYRVDALTPRRNRDRRTHHRAPDGRGTALERGDALGPALLVGGVTKPRTLSAALNVQFLERRRPEGALHRHVRRAARAADRDRTKRGCVPLGPERQLSPAPATAAGTFRSAVNPLPIRELLQMTLLAGQHEAGRDETVLASSA